MKTMIRVFTSHPASVGETYLTHMRMALGFALTMLRLALASCIHAVFPFLFTDTASQNIIRLHERLVVGRRKR